MSDKCFIKKDLKVKTDVCFKFLIIFVFHQMFLGNVVCECLQIKLFNFYLEYSGVKLAYNIKHMKYTMPSMRINTFNSTHQKFGQQELALIYKSKHCPSSVLSRTLWTGENKNRVVWYGVHGWHSSLSLQLVVSLGLCLPVLCPSLSYWELFKFGTSYVAGLADT